MPQKSASVSLDQTARAGVVGGHRVLMPGQVGRERVWLPVKHASWLWCAARWLPHASVPPAADF